MSLDNPTKTERAIDTWSKWPMWIRAAVPLCICLLLLLLVLFGVKQCDTWSFNREMKQANANLMKELDKLSNVQAQQDEKQEELRRLELEEATQKQIVIQAAKEAEAAANAEREAQRIANQAVENVNAINAKDFSNSSLENAEKARCKALPDSPECKQ